MVKLAVCQLESSSDPDRNAETIADTVKRHPADLFVFPELYLTRYGSEDYSPETLQKNITGLQELCRTCGKAVAVGVPSYRDGKRYNSLYFITPEKTVRYDKLHLANFGKYAETGYSQGDRLVTAEWRGFRFGLLICYDIMFPEESRSYALRGSDALLVIAASLKPSERFMRTVLPARALENTVYTVFCNNTGKYGGDEYFGGSSVYSPLGEMLETAGTGEEIIQIDLDHEVVSTAREARPHLKDCRSDLKRP